MRTVDEAADFCYILDEDVNKQQELEEWEKVFSSLRFFV